MTTEGSQEMFIDRLMDQAERMIGGRNKLIDAPTTATDPGPGLIGQANLAQEVALLQAFQLGVRVAIGDAPLNSSLAIRLAERLREGSSPTSHRVLEVDDSGENDDPNVRIWRNGQPSR